MSYVGILSLCAREFAIPDAEEIVRLFPQNEWHCAIRPVHISDGRICTWLRETAPHAFAASYPEWEKSRQKTCSQCPFRAPFYERIGSATVLRHTLPFDVVLRWIRYTYPKGSTLIVDLSGAAASLPPVQKRLDEAIRMINDLRTDYCLHPVFLGGAPWQMRDAASLSRIRQIEGVAVDLTVADGLNLTPFDDLLPYRDAYRRRLTDYLRDLYRK